MCSFHQFRSILTVWTVRTVRRTLLPFSLVEQFYENKKSLVKHPRYDAALPIFSCFGNNGFDAGIRFRNIIQYTKFYLYGVIYRGLIGLIWGVGKHVIINTNKPFLYIRERFFHRIFSHQKIQNSEFSIKDPSGLRLDTLNI